MTRKSFSHLALGILLASAGLSAQAAGKWPTTRFTAHVGDPFHGQQATADALSLKWLEFEDLLGTPDDAVRKEVLQAFAEAAKWFEEKGFPAPALDMVQTEDGPAYKIYLCTEDAGQAVWNKTMAGLGLGKALLPWGNCSKLGAYTSQCGDDTTRNRTLYVNYSKTGGGRGGLTESAYQTMAHELMHAIVQNTAFGKSEQSCRVNGWITEGIADAISYDLAEELWEGDRYAAETNPKAVVKRWGVRPYVETLPQKLRAQIPLAAGGSMVPGDYTTSSFFRFVADGYRDGWKVLVRGDRGGAPGLLDRALPAGKPRHWKREVDWLDAGLRDLFNLNLGEIYGLFASSFSHRFAPLPQLNELSTEAKLERWVKRIFGKCGWADISLTGRMKVELDLNPLAASCIWVEPTKRPGLIQISFMAAGDDPDFLESIIIGRADTTLLVRGSVVNTPAANAKHVVNWRDFPQDGSKRTLYIVSNVAKKPSQTRAGKITLTAALPGYQTSFGTAQASPARVAPAPVEPAEKRHAPTIQKQKSATQKMLREQIEFDRRSLNNRVSGSTKVSRETRILPCGRPFVFEACGDHTAITLELRPGTYMQMGQATSQGGEAAQAFGSLMNVATANPLGAQQSMQELAAMMDRVDASRIKIAIPLIDYGYTGNFSNASIEVTMAGGKILRAIDEPDAGGRTRLIGNVTIEEYSPLVARGRFSAPLAEVVPGPDGSPSYKRHRDIEGVFTSVAPWRFDDRSEVRKQSDREIADDIAKSLGISAETYNSLKQKGQIPGYGAATSAGGTLNSGDSASGECSCECDNRAAADELCEFFCEEEFAACEQR